MSTPIQLDYRGVMEHVLGPEHGLAPADLDRLAGRVREAVERIERERPAGRRRYRDLPDDERMLSAVLSAAERCRRDCDNLVVLGIGGSALGNIALQTALNSTLWNLLPAGQRRGPRLFVMDNVDPLQFGALLEYLDGQWNRTLVNVISKSGETAETAAQFLIVRDMLEQKLGQDEAARRIVVTTDPAGGAMRRIAQDAGYLSLDVPPGVGGRFSVLSAVGLFSAAMCGIDVRGVMSGARDMSRRVANPVLRENPAAMIAAIHFLYYHLGKKLHVMMPYSAHLKDLADWYRQLWAESLGKRLSLDGREVFIGPTPIKALGATDQHSQVQLYREGPNDKVFTFLAVEHFDRDVPIPDSPSTPEALAYLGGASLGKLLNAELAATEFALLQSHRPCLSVRFPRITPAAVGEFFMLYESAVSIIALLFGIDAYDQPAVQAGKDGTFALMGRAGYEELASRIQGGAVMDMAYVV